MNSEYPDKMTTPRSERESPSRSVNVPAEKLGQAAFELYAASSEAISLAAELETSNITPLGEMRAWLRANTGRIALGKIPEAYHEAGSSINKIHQDYKLADLHNPLPDHAPARLLANYIRYRETCDNADPSEMTHDFLAKLYEVYLSDAKTFLSMTLPKPRT